MKAARPCVEAVLAQPSRARFQRVGRGVGEDHHAGVLRQIGQGVGRPLDRIEIVRSMIKELVEQGLAGLEVEMLDVAGPVQVLEQGEAVDPHLVAVTDHEALEAAHEAGQHLVDVDDQQRRGGRNGQIRDGEGQRRPGLARV
jgi:hypothetical protein